MLSPETRSALRRQWLDDLTAEIARRTKTRADSADAERQRLLAELEEMGRRFLAVTPPERAGLPSKAATVEELIQANGDWSRIDSNGNLAIKLLRTFTTQVEALQRYLGKGQQKVTVEHVHVNAGGQKSQMRNVPEPVRPAPPCNARTARVRAFRGLGGSCRMKRLKWSVCWWSTQPCSLR